VLGGGAYGDGGGGCLGSECVASFIPL
jgi:hypothetical protein